MTLFLVPRTRAYLSEEELAAASGCLHDVVAAMPEDIRWIRSYVVAEEDGTYSTYCIYESEDPDAVRRHSEALMLPTDAIKPIVATTVNAPDPEPVATA